MTLLENIGYSFLYAVINVIVTLMIFSPIIFSVLHGRNIRKYKKLKKEWEGNTDDIRAATLKKKKSHIIFYSVALAIFLILYIIAVLISSGLLIGHLSVLQIALIILILLPYIALYSIPWYLVSFAIVSFIRFMLYRGKNGGTEEQIIKERKKRKIIFIVSSIVAIIVFILYSTVIFKSLSEISFM